MLTALPFALLLLQVVLLKAISTPAMMHPIDLDATGQRINRCIAAGNLEMAARVCSTVVNPTTQHIGAMLEAALKRDRAKVIVVSDAFLAFSIGYKDSSVRPALASICFVGTLALAIVYPGAATYTSTIACGVLLVPSVLLAGKSERYYQNAPLLVNMLKHHLVDKLISLEKELAHARSISGRFT